MYNNTRHFTLQMKQIWAVGHYKIRYAIKTLNTIQKNLQPQTLTRHSNYCPKKNKPLKDRQSNAGEVSSFSFRFASLTQTET